jgi:uncharacterized protein YhfF/ribosomal protein S18 acetylase RimI-like enzyme
MARTLTADLLPYWRAFCERAGADLTDRFCESFHFDDNERSADELARLVLSGTKRASAGLQWSFEAAGVLPPKPGDLSIVTNWAGVPQCVIETTDVELVPFDQVGAEFAATEGEGDGSLAYWQSAHQAYFGRECVRLGRQAVPDMPVVCERFRVVWRGDDNEPVFLQSRVLLRPAVPADALCLSVLAMQVFLDTYATQGIRPAIAREALGTYSTAEFDRLMAEPGTRLCVAEHAGLLVGFSQTRRGASHALLPAGEPAELARLYVQARFKGRRIGQRLLREAELHTQAQGASVLWLSAWVHNQPARAFYARQGYDDVGSTTFSFEGEDHENRVLVKALKPAYSAARTGEME